MAWNFQVLFFPRYRKRSVAKFVGIVTIRFEPRKWHVLEKKCVSYFLGKQKPKRRWRIKLKNYPILTQELSIGLRILRRVQKLIQKHRHLPIWVSWEQIVLQKSATSGVRTWILTSLPANLPRIFSYTTEKTEFQSVLWIFLVARVSFKDPAFRYPFHQTTKY